MRGAELVPRHGRHGDEIARLDRPHLAADQAVAAPAQDQHRVHVLVPLQRGEAARRHLEIAQLPVHLRIGEQHLPRDRLEQRAVVFLVGKLLDALPAIVLRLAMDRSVALAISRISSVCEAMHLGHKGRGRFDQPLARFEQGAADQQHDIGAVEIKHLGHPIGGHAAGRNRQAGPQPVAVRQSRLRQRAGRYLGSSRSVRHGWETRPRRRRTGGTACRAGAAGAMRAAPPMLGWATKAICGCSRTSRWKLESPTIIGAIMTVSMPAAAATAICAAHAVEIARQARHIARARRSPPDAASAGAMASTRAANGE